MANYNGKGQKEHYFNFNWRIVLLLFFLTLEKSNSWFNEKLSYTKVPKILRQSSQTLRVIISKSVCLNLCHNAEIQCESSAFFSVVKPVSSGFVLLPTTIPPPTQLRTSTLNRLLHLCHDLSAHLQMAARAVRAETHCFSSRWQCQEWSHFMCERKACCVLTEQRLKAETVLDDNSPSTTRNGTLVTHALYLTSQRSFYYLPGTLGNLCVCFLYLQHESDSQILSNNFIEATKQYEIWKILQNSGDKKKQLQCYGKNKADAG